MKYKDSFKNKLSRFWRFLKQDTWQAWIVSLILAFIFIKFIFFPFLSFLLGTNLPLVVVESCSMYHGTDFDSWFGSNGGWYEEKRGISKEEFEDFKFKNGLNKGDIVLIYGKGNYKIGDVIVFESSYRHPLIHRIVREDEYATKGDNNANQLPAELNISPDAIVGKSVAKIPGLGWIKLIFFEKFRSPNERGFCK
jgi:signal peptidase I